MAPIQDRLAADDEEAFAERSAIMQYDGGMSADAAEAAARVGFSIDTHFDLRLIQADDRTQSRVSINDATVHEYAEALQVGAVDLPAVIVFFDGADHWLADGWHRVAAYRKRSRVTIPAKLHSGTQRDAILYAAGANADHGLRRSNEDKRKSVGLLLGDPEWCKLSNREIARLCKVDHTSVANWRNPPPPPKPPGGEIATPKHPPSPPPTEGGAAAPTPPEDTTAADAHGADTTIQSLLEETVKELDEARELLTAAAADDQKAETMKWKRLADVAQRAKDDVQTKLVKREAEIKRHVTALKRIGAAVGEEDPARVAATVEEFVKNASLSAHEAETP